MDLSERRGRGSSDSLGTGVANRDGAVRFTVRVQPRASRTGISGWQGDTLKVRVQSSPVDGAANDALIDLLARTLGVARRQVAIVSGHTSRLKTVEVHSIDRTDLDRLLTST